MVVGANIRLVIIILSIWFTTGKGGQKRLRHGACKTIDVEDPKFDVTEELMKEDTDEKRKQHLKKICTTEEPAEVILKSRSGVDGTYIVLLCNMDEDRSFRGEFANIIVDEMLDPDKKMLMVRVETDLNTVYRIANHPDVAEIEQENYVKIERACDRQKIEDPNLWGLDRIGGRKQNGRRNVLDERYSFNLTNQENIDVYVIDTGITLDEKEFGSRIKEGVVCVTKGCFSKENLPGPRPELNDTLDLRDQSPTRDVIGHGTQVAGIVGSKTYGVAKNVNLYPVKLVDFRGDERLGRFTLLTIIHAMNWTLNQIRAKNKERFSIVNMSLGGPMSKCMNRIIDNMVSNDIVVTAAAGNELQDACKSSPGSAAGAMTVACITKGDSNCFFSNTGRCVDLFAPGLAIISVSNKGGSRVGSGTSFSTPHVTGAVAILKAQFYEEGGLSARKIKDIIIGRSTKNAVLDIVDPLTPNRLLNVKCRRPDIEVD